jgi:hypothetical protein
LAIPTDAAQAAARSQWVYVLRVDHVAASGGLLQPVAPRE